MFDLGKITDTIGSLFSSTQQQPETGGIQQLLSDAGIDPAMLDGLSRDEVFNLLQQYGIDPGQLDVGQIGDLSQSTGVGGSLAELTQAWLDQRGS